MATSSSELTIFEGCVDTLPELQPGEKQVLGQRLSPNVTRAYELEKTRWAKQHHDEPLLQIRFKEGSLTADATYRRTAEDFIYKWLVENLTRQPVGAKDSAEYTRQFLNALPPDVPVTHKVQKARVPVDDPRIGLRGEWGCVAGLPAGQSSGLAPDQPLIKKGEVIGVYRGRLMFTDEYRVHKTNPVAAYSRGMPRWKNMCDSYGVDIIFQSFTGATTDLVKAPGKVAIPHLKGTGGGAATKQVRKGSGGRQRNREQNREIMDYVMVSSAYTFGNLTALVNDPTIDALNEGEECVRETNSHVSDVQIGGWVFPIMLASADIFEGEELAYAYGPSYWELFADQQLDIQYVDKLQAENDNLRRKLHASEERGAALESKATLLLNSLAEGGLLPCNDAMEEATSAEARMEKQSPRHGLSEVQQGDGQPAHSASHAGLPMQRSLGLPTPRSARPIHARCSHSLGKKRRKLHHGDVGRHHSAHELTMRTGTDGPSLPTMTSAGRPVQSYVSSQADGSGFVGRLILDEQEHCTGVCDTEAQAIEALGRLMEARMDPNHPLQPKMLSGTQSGTNDVGGQGEIPAEMADPGDTQAASFDWSDGGTPARSSGQAVRYAGVISRPKTGMHDAIVKHNGKVYMLGSFRTQMQAAIAVDLMKRQLRQSGQNFPHQSTEALVWKKKAMAAKACKKKMEANERQQKKLDALLKTLLQPVLGLGSDSPSTGGHSGSRSPSWWRRHPTAQRSQRTVPRPSGEWKLPSAEAELSTDRAAPNQAANHPEREHPGNQAQHASSSPAVQQGLLEGRIQVSVSGQDQQAAVDTARISTSLPDQVPRGSDQGSEQVLSQADISGQNEDMVSQKGKEEKREAPASPPHTPSGPSAGLLRAESTIAPDIQSPFAVQPVQGNEEQAKESLSLSRQASQRNSLETGIFNSGRASNLPPGYILPAAKKGSSRRKRILARKSRPGAPARSNGLPLQDSPPGSPAASISLQPAGASGSQPEVQAPNADQRPVRKELQPEIETSSANAETMTKSPQPEVKAPTAALGSPIRQARPKSAQQQTLANVEGRLGLAQPHSPAKSPAKPSVSLTEKRQSTDTSGQLAAAPRRSSMPISQQHQPVNSAKLIAKSTESMPVEVWRPKEDNRMKRPRSLADVASPNAVSKTLTTLTSTPQKAVLKRPRTEASPAAKGPVANGAVSPEKDVQTINPSTAPVQAPKLTLRIKSLGQGAAAKSDALEKGKSDFFLRRKSVPAVGSADDWQDLNKDASAPAAKTTGIGLLDKEAAKKSGVARLTTVLSNLNTQQEKELNVKARPLRAPTRKSKVRNTARRSDGTGSGNKVQSPNGKSSGRSPQPPGSPLSPRLSPQPSQTGVGLSSKSQDLDLARAQKPALSGSKLVSHKSQTAETSKIRKLPPPQANLLMKVGEHNSLRDKMPFRSRLTSSQVSNKPATTQAGEAAPQAAPAAPQAANERQRSLPFPARASLPGQLSGGLAAASQAMPILRGNASWPGPARLPQRPFQPRDSSPPAIASPQAAIVSETPEAAQPPPAAALAQTPPMTEIFKSGSAPASRDPRLSQNKASPSVSPPPSCETAPQTRLLFDARNSPKSPPEADKPSTGKQSSDPDSLLKPVLLQSIEKPQTRLSDVESPPTSPIENSTRDATAKPVNSPVTSLEKLQARTTYIGQLNDSFLQPEPLALDDDTGQVAESSPDDNDFQITGLLGDDDLELPSSPLPDDFSMLDASDGPTMGEMLAGFQYPKSPRKKHLEATNPSVCPPLPSEPT